jgi:hypothetical protein
LEETLGKLLYIRPITEPNDTDFWRLGFAAALPTLVLCFLWIFIDKLATAGRINANMIMPIGILSIGWFIFAWIQAKKLGLAKWPVRCGLCIGSLAAKLAAYVFLTSLN